MKAALREGLNTIEVHFESPVKYSARMFSDQVTHGHQETLLKLVQVAERHLVPPECVPEVFQGVCHANHIRKMQVSDIFITAKHVYTMP